MITLIPMNGLCNRMRVVDSAITMCEKEQRQLRIYWVKNRALACHFTELFEPIRHPLVKIKSVSQVFRPLIIRDADEYRFRRLRRLQQIAQSFFFDRVVTLRDSSRVIRDRHGLAELLAEKNILISAQHRFFNVSQPHYRGFVPVRPLRQRVERLRQRFSDQTIGVHVRHGDHQWGHSPLSLFISVMEAEIDRDSRTRFFIASDSDEVKVRLAQHFGPRALFHCFDRTDRLTRTGMEKAVVDLYALAATRKIIGTYRSSFSATAAQISRIDLFSLAQGIHTTDRKAILVENTPWYNQVREGTT